MTPGRLQAIEEIFYAALDCEPDQISAFLEIRCAGDEGLRTKVETLLASHREAATSVETSIAAVAANLIENEQRGSLIDQTIGHYKILKQIGAGGMGEVYLACDITVGRNAALKVLPAHLTRNAERLARFQQEARTVAGLNHLNIVTIYEVGAADTTRYIASELIEGETLHQRLARGRIEVKEAIDIAIQVASALAAAHSAGVVHRDVKPENVMLRPDGYVKVLDFGIAKLGESAFAETTADGAGSMTLAETNLGSILGTVRYMSPEQARGASVDKRSDIWSLGVVLYEMVTGCAPFTGNPPSQSYGAGTLREAMAAILTMEPPSIRGSAPQAPVELQQIVTKSLRKNPEERYQSANEMLEALKVLRHKLEFTAELERSADRHPRLRWIRSPIAAALAVLAGALSLALSLYWLRNPATTEIPEKSIAVLPFENLSDDKQNSYFADGIQDELLSDLAKVADLKVISRTSVMRYKSGSARDVREIGHQLGVANVLEGSVQRSSNRVRVNAQLIDARTDRHLWAQTYDRDVADVFTVQSDIAKTIATQLQARLSPSEKAEIDRLPTSDLTAFNLYTHAKNLILETTLNSEAKADLLQAAELLNQAVTHDPSFFEAYCELAYTNDSLYFSGYDHTSARLALAEAAIQAAARLHPDAGETHLAQAWNLYSGYLDYDGALAELERARQSLPNDSHVFQLAGFIQRRQGRWEESTRNLERAIDLDPSNVYTLQQVAISYDYLRRYADEESALDRLLAIEPNDIDTRIGHGWVELNWHADTRPLRQTLNSIRVTNPAAMSRIADAWLLCALSEHDPDFARDALVFAEEKPHVSTDNVPLSRLFLQGLIARMTNDAAKARSAFTAARAEQEKAVQAQPNYGPAMCLLGLIDAALGRKDQALREGRRAVQLLPVEKDAINGPAMIKYLSVIAAWTGENNLACEQLATAIRFPSCLSYGQLKLLPFWDPLRADPRFEQIAASLAPKAN
jgi:eukaryotic-like serine/threonine-protein kinase